MFYFWGEGRGVLLLVALAILNLAFGKALLLTAGRTRKAVLVAALRAAGHAVTYPQAALLKASQTEQVYFKTDTHWNHAGAGVAYRELMADLKVPVFEGAVITHAPSRYRGDLAAISGKGEALPIVNSIAANLSMPATRIRWKPAGVKRHDF